MLERKWTETHTDR